MTAILGISAFYHDSAAALVVDGEIVAAAEEERWSRKKHDEGFPAQAIAYCLREAGLEPGQIDYVGFYDKPVLKFDRLLETYISFAPRGFKSFTKAMPLWLSQKLHLKRELDRGLGGAFRRRYVYTHHHESHAASAFFPSPFEEAAILTLDGVGEWSTASTGVGRGNRITIDHELRFPHSLGLLYSAFTYFCGFKVNSDEYKLMGLAPYGEPRYMDLLLKKVVDVREDGSLHLDLTYFDYCHGLKMTSRKMDTLFGGPPRKSEAPITDREMDLAASVQKVTEEIVLRASRALHARTGMRKLCLAGGVALNCVANGRVLREGPFEDVWIQPAAGDAGGALGAALFIWHQLLDKPRTPVAHDAMRGSLLGPRFEEEEIRSLLQATGAKFQRFDDDAVLCDAVASRLAAGQVIGWFQDRMEFGPRALGARSILADARNPEAQSIVNQKVKFREGFRPFAPAVLQERVHEWFETRPEEESPYMLLVAPVHASKRLKLSAEEAAARGIAKLKVQRSTIPAVTHVDHSARIQTVDRDRHGRYRQLLEAFERRTGSPVLVNTSFNLSWEPIVCTPRNAFETFMASNIDVLCMGNYLVEKSAQPAWVANGNRSANRSTASAAATRALLDRSWRDRLARAIDTALPYNSHVLVVGTKEARAATGDLTNLLGISCRRVVGFSAEEEALRVAEDFRRSNELDRVLFVRGDLRQPPFRERAFDALILLAPADGAALSEWARLVRLGGHVVLVENRVGVSTSIHDFERAGLELVRAVPPLTSNADDLGHGNLFVPHRAPTSSERGIATLRRAVARRKPGALLGDLSFLTVARVPERQVS